MLDNRIPRIAVTAALALGTAGIASVVGAGTAGATGTVATSLLIEANGSKVASTTTSPVSTLLYQQLPPSATGTVEFSQGGSPLCTATLPAKTCQTATLAIGSYPGITATYSGDATFAGSTSTNSVDLTVVAPGTTSTCSKVSGVVTKKITFSFCQHSQKGAQLLGSNLLTGGVLTWNGSKGTTTFSASATSPGQGVCTVGHVEEDVTGSVTADTSTFATVGDTVSYDVCQTTATGKSLGVVKLVAGTKASF
jgi:hypothetical protein